MGRTWEISGNLNNEKYGLSDYKRFEHVICQVKAVFDQVFGVDLLSKIPFYVDNATANSGYTPSATIVLGKTVIIKLGITSDSSNELIAFQFSHELMHVVFWAVFGLDKPFANGLEEQICSAASLIIIRMLYLHHFDSWNSYVSNLENCDYARGAALAKDVGYDLSKLLPLAKAIQY